LIGGTAHATSPQLGQGANLALVDAMVLGDCLGEFAERDEALRQFESRRKHHLAFYQFATRWATPFFQSSYPPLGWTRDALFGFAGRIGWVRREMILSMVGVKRGFLRRSMPIPELAPMPEHGGAIS